jgi:hypothetical protein
VVVLRDWYERKLDLRILTQVIITMVLIRDNFTDLYAPKRSFYRRYPVFQTSITITQNQTLRVCNTVNWNAKILYEDTRFDITYE